MEGENRKRKMEDDEDVEEKMKKFFALVKSTRDVRERMMGEKKKDEEEKTVGVLNPSFQPEDFMEGGGGDKSKGPQASLAPAGPSKREDEGKEEDKGEEGGGDGDGLDLKLSL